MEVSTPRASTGQSARPREGQHLDLAPRHEPFIDVRNASLTYLGRGGSHVQALKAVSFQAGAEQFVSLLGPSGCGKTTLLKALGDLLQLSSGTVLIGGRPPAELRRARQIGNMFQDSVLLPWKTVDENIRFLCDVAGRPITEQHLDELAMLVGLTKFRRKYPHELSGGMKQRAAIARAYALDPVLFLMDEPFGALDEITRHRMNLELLRTWSERRKTVVFITHSIAEAVFLSDKVLVMASRPGTIVAEISIDLPRPRTGEMRFSREMTDYVALLHHYLEAAESAAPDSEDEGA